MQSMHCHFHYNFSLSSFILEIFASQLLQIALATWELNPASWVISIATLSCWKCYCVFIANSSVICHDQASWKDGMEILPLFFPLIWGCQITHALKYQLGEKKRESADWRLTALDIMNMSGWRYAEQSFLLVAHYWNATRWNRQLR